MQAVVGGIPQGGEYTQLFALVTWRTYQVRTERIGVVRVDWWETCPRTFHEMPVVRPRPNVRRNHQTEAKGN